MPVYRGTSLFMQATRRLSTKPFVKDILGGGSGGGELHLTVEGWVKGIRKYKDVTFLDVNDGSTVKSLQVVASTTSLPKNVVFGASVHIEGSLKESESAKQKFELEASSIHVVGDCDNTAYPFKHKTRHTLEHARQFLHLRSRTNAFAALLRLRHAAMMSFHSFFAREGFLNVHTPVLTSNDCEGAGDLFTVKSIDGNPDSGNEGQDFFDKQTYLTVSGQLHLETVCCSHGRVYTFNPAFRAENSRSRRHLAEFYMIEAEIPFTKDISDLTNCMESLIRSVTEEVYSKNEDDMQLFNEYVAKGHKETIEECLRQPFIVMSYEEALNILRNSNQSWNFQPEWGEDLQSEHEKYLVMHCGNRPIFVVDYPSSLKAFYAKSNDDQNQTVSAVDLLVPGVGELIGGSLREHRLEVLQQKLASLGLEKDYQWYLDLRRFGSIPHGGFGVGFERFLVFLLGIENIRDVIPFPRYTGSCVL